MLVTFRDTRFELSGSCPRAILHAGNRPLLPSRGQVSTENDLENELDSSPFFLSLSLLCSPVICKTWPRPSIRLIERSYRLRSKSNFSLQPLRLSNGTTEGIWRIWKGGGKDIDDIRIYIYIGIVVSFRVVEHEARAVVGAG